MPIDLVIIQARLGAAKNDTGLFAAAYREHVPELLKRLEFLQSELARVISHRQVGQPAHYDPDDPWTNESERRADQLLQGCREYADEVHAVAAIFDLVDALVGALLGVEWTSEDLEIGPVTHTTPPGCGHCGAAGWASEPRFKTHEPQCPVDAALTLAGFPDQASRDAERSRRATLASKTVDSGGPGMTRMGHILESEKWK